MDRDGRNEGVSMAHFQDQCKPGRGLKAIVLLVLEYLLKGSTQFLLCLSQCGWTVIRDVYAILLAAHHPNARLLGVSTVHGNAPLEQTTLNTCAVLEAIGKPSIPVVRGCARPLVRDPTFAPEYHGASGLGGVSLLPEPSSSKLGEIKTGVAEIYKFLINEPDDSVWIIATGPLTNIARLIMDHSDIVSVIKGISIMGGAIGGGYSTAPVHRLDGPGNWTQWAEFNIFCDPEAAQFIFETHALAKKPKYMATLDLTHHCRANKVVLSQLFEMHEPLSLFRRMMRQVLTFFAESYRSQSEGLSDGPPLHDPLAVFVVIMPEKFSTDNSQQWAVNVTLEGEAAGQTSLRPISSNGVGVTVANEINVREFWSTIDQSLDRAERVSPMRL